MSGTTRPLGARVEIRPGEGGDDAHLFAHELAGAVRAWARRNDVPVDDAPGEGRTLVLVVPAPAGRQLAPLAGAHRIQREPRNGGGKRHTSTATVAILEEGDVVDVVLDPADVDEEVFRGTGPGGQHRNKTASDVRLVHRPSGTTVTASGRSQWQNRQKAWAELERRLAGAAEERRAGELNTARRTQVVADRSAKGWTWNDQRDEVVDHGTGERYRMRRMLAGRLP